MNEGRYRKFELAYLPRKPSEPLTKSFAAFDSASIPPCRSVLKMHLKRSILQAYVWLYADKDDPASDIGPLDYGWKIVEFGHQYEHIWFEGEVAPPTVIKVLEESNEESGKSIMAYSWLGKLDPHSEKCYYLSVPDEEMDFEYDEEPEEDEDEGA